MAMIEGLREFRRANGDSGSVLLVVFSGEWDVRYRRTLEETLGAVLSQGEPTFVDLSGITFLDASCAEELAVQHQLHADALVLCNPSPEVELAVSACDLEGWIEFARIGGGSDRPRDGGGTRVPGGSARSAGSRSAETNEKERGAVIEVTEGG